MEMTLRKAWRRLKSENGSVGVVVAIVLFLSLGLVTMTWNTAQLSKAKMRLQNAADSAALAHAIWQARGMNTVQNINDEMYESLAFAIKIRKAAKVSVQTAIAFDAMSAVPFIGPVMSALAKVAHVIGVLLGGPAGWMANRVCKLFLKNFAMVYAKGSAMLGMWNAQQLAAQNEADPLAKLDATDSTADSDSWHFGIYALGVSSPVKDAFVLPLAESGCDEVSGSPWKVGKESLFESSALVNPWKTIYKVCGTAGEWEIKPYVSKRGDKEGLQTKKKKDEKGKETGKVEVEDDSVLPGPTLWVAVKFGSNIETMPFDAFYNDGDRDRWTHKMPMIAVSAAQCITGDVIPHSKKMEKGTVNQRPAGMGSGATAKLVPVSEVFYKMNKAAGYIVDAVIYH